MKPSKEIIPSLILVLTGTAVLISCFFYLKNGNNEFEPLTGLILIIVALATSSVCIALPGFIKLNSTESLQNKMSPNITASGALAIFVLVYLFNPIG